MRGARPRSAAAIPNRYPRAAWDAGGGGGQEGDDEPGVLMTLDTAETDLTVYDPPTAPPTWSGKAARDLTAAEVLDVLSYMETNGLGDETLARVLAGLLVTR